MTEKPFYKFRGYKIPVRMQRIIERYIHEHIQPGDFLTAVIENDLASACMRADDENLANIPAYVAYFYNEAPGGCWGSAEKRRAWQITKRDL